MSNGVISCGQSSDSAQCVVHLIECIISFLMLIMVIFIIFKLLAKNMRVNFNLIVLIMIFFFLVFLIAHSITYNYKIFDFLYHYFYNVYFSIIVLKLSLKVQEKYKQSKNYQFMHRTTYVIFAIYNVCIIISFAYSIIYQQVSCLYLPYLIINAIGFSIAVIFLILGVNHFIGQQQKFDQNMPQNLQNNPMPRFKVWIITNCISQSMVLVQAIIYQFNNCSFSSNTTVNQIVKLVFVFLSYHIGTFSTLYFFLYSAPHSSVQNRLISPTISRGNHDETRQIQMIYYKEEDTRSKTISI